MESANENKPYRVHWINTIFLTTTLVVALVGTPWFLLVYGGEVNLWLHAGMFVGLFIASGLGITLGYHRLLSHLSFEAKWPVKLAALIGGATAMQDSALAWCSNHRRHHKHVDHDDDPYNITKGFWHAHIGWILFKPLLEPDRNNVADLRKDPLVMWQYKWWGLLGLGIGFGLPALIGGLVDGPIGVLGGLIIGGCARLVLMNHMTFFINSLCHYMGKQPYSSSHTAKDSWFMAIFTFGEGYHNYHHEFQHDYRNGVKPWQFDPTKWTVWTLSKIGLAKDLRRVSDEKISLAEIREKNLLLEKRLSNHNSPVCEKARDFYDRAHEELASATETWEKAKKEYALALREKFDATKEQISELQDALDSALNDLQAAINEWNAAHGQLVGQMA